MWGRGEGGGGVGEKQRDRHEETPAAGPPPSLSENTPSPLIFPVLHLLASRGKIRQGERGGRAGFCVTWGGMRQGRRRTGRRRRDQGLLSGGGGAGGESGGGGVVERRICCGCMQRRNRPNTPLRARGLQRRANAAGAVRKCCTAEQSKNEYVIKMGGGGGGGGGCAGHRPRESNVRFQRHAIQARGGGWQREDGVAGRSLTVCAHSERRGDFLLYFFFRGKENDGVSRGGGQGSGVEGGLERVGVLSNSVGRTVR